MNYVICILFLTLFLCSFKTFIAVAENMLKIYNKDHMKVELLHVLSFMKTFLTENVNNCQQLLDTVIVSVQTH